MNIVMALIARVKAYEAIRLKVRAPESCRMIELYRAAKFSALILTS